MLRPKTGEAGPESASMLNLSKYRKMRHFEQTAEPRGGARKPARSTEQRKTELSYVIQKHAARNLHYDFRLELGGVLLSWAVPKGPSTDPAVKRLAVETEPHPLEYGGFEGTIPKGQYGGGAVMVWDRGSWVPEGDAQQGYEQGRLSFTLRGEKLHGAWHLVRTRRGADGDKNWLLFKSRDDFARPGNDGIVEEFPDSAVTGRTIEEIAEGGPDYASNAKREGPAKVKAKPSQSKAGEPKAGQSKAGQSKAGQSKAGQSKAGEPKAGQPKAGQPKPPKSKASKQLDTATLLAVPGAKAGRLPLTLEPELATLVDAAPAGDEWVHEIKFDGYRALGRLNQGKVTVLTRNGKDWTARFPVLAKALRALPVDEALIDGEFVSLNEQGVSDFQALQNSLSDGPDEQNPGLAYYAFDLLHLNGVDVRGAPLLERKALLRQALELLAPDAAQVIRFSDHVVGGGAEFFAKAGQMGLEGIISKRSNAPYRSGRGRDWLKVKCTLRQEFVVVGFTAPGGSRMHLGALLLGTHKRDGLVYAGRVGTRFSARSLREVYQKLKPLIVQRPPVSNAPRGAEVKTVQWVKPTLVAEVAFTGFTGDGLLRHPAFLGLREDKTGAEVNFEESEKLEASEALQPRKVEKEADEMPKKSERPQPKSTVSYPLTHPDKILYPDDGITKGELLDYYALVAERMLPHVRNRPLTLVRCPNGFGKPCFFQKHPGKGTPPGLRSVTIREQEGKAPYSVIDDANGLFGLVQLGALEIHTWGSAADDFEHPNLLVFDLDPAPDLEFSAVIRCAERLRDSFESVKLESFVKTTGGKGLHVCVPVAPDLSWEEAKTFSKQVAEEFVRQAPGEYVATQSKAVRKGKIFIDYLRNGRGATFIAPYSTRNREHAPVAVPLEWDELTPRQKPELFTIRTLPARLRRLERDPFERMATLKQRLPRA